jgi:hypothetical protein
VPGKSGNSEVFDVNLLAPKFNCRRSLVATRGRSDCDPKLPLAPRLSFSRVWPPEENGPSFLAKAGIELASTAGSERPQLSDSRGEIAGSSGLILRIELSLGSKACPLDLSLGPRAADLDRYFLNFGPSARVLDFYCQDVIAQKFRR